MMMACCIVLVLHLHPLNRNTPVQAALCVNTAMLTLAHNSHRIVACKLFECAFLERMCAGSTCDRRRKDQEILIRLF